MALLVAGLFLAFAGTAKAQIVFVRNGAIWAMNDDGSGQRQLIAASQDGNNDPLNYDASLSNPDVFQKGGQAVVFEGVSACSAGCYDAVGIYQLASGQVTRLTPDPWFGGAVLVTSGEMDPRLTANSLAAFEYVYDETSPIYDVQSSLDTRSLADGTEQSWSTGPNAEKGLPTPDPADPTTMAWLDDADNIHINHRNDSGDIVIGGDAPLTPTSMSWSDDGTRLIASDSNGIGELTGVGTSSEGEPQVYNTSFATGDFVGTARFMGNNGIVFAERGNIYTIPASCGTPSPCTISNAKALTTDGKSSEPAWTSSATPIQAYAPPSPPPSPVPTPPGPKPPGPKPLLPVVQARCVVPKLKGLTLSRAKQALARNDCRLGKVTHRRTHAVKHGRVATSSPGAGKHLAAGTRVALVLAR
jgi:hypothetical protein